MSSDTREEGLRPPFFALCEWHSGQILIRVVDKSLKNKGKLSVARIDPSLVVKTVRFSIHYVIHAYTHNSVISTYNTSIIFGIWDKKREKIIKTRRYC